MHKNIIKALTANIYFSTVENTYIKRALYQKMQRINYTKCITFLYNRPINYNHSNI